MKFHVLTHLNYSQEYEEPGQEGFFKQHPDWAEEPILENMAQYGQTLLESSGEVVASKKMSKKKPLLDLEQNKAGHYLLPDELPTKLAEKKSLLRAVITLSYRKSFLWQIQLNLMLLQEQPQEVRPHLHLGGKFQTPPKNLSSSTYYPPVLFFKSPQKLGMLTWTTYSPFGVS